MVRGTEQGSEGTVRVRERGQGEAGSRGSACNYLKTQGNRSPRFAWTAGQKCAGQWQDRGRTGPCARGSSFFS
jgi:hypothetical protein